MADYDYDLVVIGSGPAGQRGAIAAAKLGKRVAVVDRREMTGGVCVHTGTIPSKTLREAILYLSGFRQRTFYGKDYVVSDRISARDLAHRVQHVIEREVEVVRNQLRRNGVTSLVGTARFSGPDRGGNHVVDSARHAWGTGGFRSTGSSRTRASDLLLP